MTVGKTLMHAIAAVALPVMVAGVTPAQAAEVTRIIVPFGPGGINDVVARIVAEELTSSKARETIVLNKPGGSATIGMGEVAVAEPNGYTLGMANITFNVNPSLMKEMPYDAEKDFAPIGMLATVPYLLAVHPDIPARSPKELAEMLKANPGKYGYSSSGYGNGTHLSAELFMNITGTTMTHVPYKGGSEHVVASLNGETGIMFASLPTVLEFVRSKQLIPLAVTSAERDPRLPDVPSMQEEGFAAFVMFDYPSIVAPAATPRAVIDEISAQVLAALAVPAVRAKIEAVGGTVVASTPAELAEHMKAERAKWAKLIKENNIEVQ